jgi:phosphomannomutase / phosphoglucomutase
MRLFGTDGVRGIVGELMTPEFATRLGRALGTHLKPGATVAIGRDTRLSGPMLSAAAVAGLLSAGVNVIRLGIAPTPAIQLYAAQHKNVDAAFIITASHNPGQWNGIKYIAGDGTEAGREDEEHVEELYFSQKFRTSDWKSVGKLSEDGSAVQAYLDAVLSKVDVKKIQQRKFKVVVDAQIPREGRRRSGAPQRGTRRHVPRPQSRAGRREPLGAQSQSESGGR